MPSDRKTLAAMRRRVREEAKRRRMHHVRIDSTPTEDDARRARELIEQYGWDELRRKP